MADQAPVASNINALLHDLRALAFAGFANARPKMHVTIELRELRDASMGFCSPNPNAEENLGRAAWYKLTLKCEDAPGPGITLHHDWEGDVQDVFARAKADVTRLIERWTGSRTTAAWKERVAQGAGRAASRPPPEPTWDHGLIPWCDVGCRYHDGKRCEFQGGRAPHICEPVVVEMGRLLQEREAGKQP